MKKHRSSIYWDRVFNYIILPIICVIILIAGIIYIPPKVIEHHKEVVAQKQIEKEAKIKSDINIWNAKQKKKREEELEKQKIESERIERENVQQSTLDYETKIANKKYCRGTCVEDEEYGVGRVVSVYGFEISTKEGWNFNYLDVENKERNITVISPKRYKKMLKSDK